MTSSVVQINHDVDLEVTLDNNDLNKHAICLIFRDRANNRTVASPYVSDDHLDALATVAGEIQVAVDLRKQYLEKLPITATEKQLEQALVTSGYENLYGDAYRNKKVLTFIRNLRSITESR